MREHRPNFTPMNSSVMCSAHFEKSCLGTTYHIDVPDGLKPKPGKGKMLIRTVGTNEGFNHSRRDTSDFAHEEKGESCSTADIMIQLAIIDNIIANSFALLRSIESFFVE